ncbi:MAG: hypothetical protein KGL68_18420 [Burkholderiales bacterium]|nr:hypothetical protein [Burkholderiales bacterium]
MQNRSAPRGFLRGRLAALLAAGCVSACGGGISIAFFSIGGGTDLSLHPSGLPSSLTVGEADDPQVNGTYGSGDTLLSDVVLSASGGGDPGTCIFRFSGLQQASGPRGLEGEIRYVAGSAVLGTTFIAIDGLRYQVDGGSLAVVDLAHDQVRYAGLVLPGIAPTPGHITLSGTVPMRDAARPVGC